MYIIENKQTNKWLTIGNNTTTDATHPGLVTFDTDEQAKLFITLTDRKEDWKTTKNKIIADKF
jgi:hypothetical protein